jgi:hypothetical protein
MRGISGLAEELVASDGMLCSKQIDKQWQCYKPAVTDTCSALRCYCRCKHPVRADSHTPCRSLAALKANSHIPCRSHAILRQCQTRTVRPHAVSGGRCYFTHTMPFPCRELAVALRGRFQNGIFVAWQGNSMGTAWHVWIKHGRTV